MIDIHTATDAELDSIAMQIDEQRPKRGLEVLCLADVQAKPIEWLWKNWVAVGKVSILAGEGGIGKSTILCDLAARTTTGNTWPDHEAGTVPGSVIILAAEDFWRDHVEFERHPNFIDFHAPTVSRGGEHSAEP